MAKLKARRSRFSLIGAFEALPAQIGRLDARDLPMPAQYAIAVGLIVIGLLVREALSPWLLDRQPFLIIFGVLLVLVVAVCPGPFFLAAVIGGLGSWYLFLPPRYSFSIESSTGSVAIGIYVFGVVCAMVTTLLATRGQQREKEAYRLAAQQRESLRVTMESIGDAVITTDFEGDVEYLNEVATQLTGWPLADAMGRPLTDVFHIINEDTRRTVENPVEKVLKLGRAVGLANHTLLVHRDGSERPIDDSAAPMRDSRGDIVGVVLVFRDVVSRRRAELQLARSERELADFFENATVGLHWIDANGRILRANRAELAMLGYTADEYVGRPIADFHADTDVIASLLERLRRGEEVRDFPARMRRKDGRMIDVLVSSSAYREKGEFLHTRCFTIDVTGRKRAEEALRESEQRFRLMADAAPVLIWLSGADKKYTWFNRRWLEFVGRSMDEQLGDGWTDSVHPEDRQRCVQTYSDAFDAREAFSIEYRLRNALGVYRWVLDSGVPRFETYGEFAGYIGSCIDITDRREIEVELARSEARFRRMADANLIGVGFGDGQGNVTYVNDEMLRMMGRSREEFEAGLVNWRDAIAPEFKDTYFRTIQRLQTDGAVTGYEKAFLRPDGERTYFLGAAALLERGSNFHVRIALDLTQLKKAQEERERLLEQVREAGRRKDEFLAVLAHELRNPLAPIKNTLEVLKRAPSDTQLLEQAREMMERQVTHMVRLIDDLLDIGRITHNRLDLRRSLAELQTIIAQAVQTVRPLADSKRQRLEARMPEQPVVLDCDFVRLTQVFVNLLDNACKYTQAEGTVTVDAQVSGTHVVVSVEDNGPGIAPDVLPSIFEMFTRGDQSLEREQGGLGLGLALVQRIVLLHGGSVEATSAGKGQGSRFMVRLPLHVPRAGETVVVPTRRTAPSRSLRLLVADDNRDATESLAALLRLEGHEVRTAFDGREAFTAAQELLPDAVLMDIGMPVLNGYEVAQLVREQPWGMEMLLIALTGWGQSDDRRRSRDAGFNAHLVKPVDHVQLLGLIAEFGEAASPDQDASPS